MGKRSRPGGGASYPYKPSPDELAARLRIELAGFVCGGCGWVLIERGRERSRACPKCDLAPMRAYSAIGLDRLASKLVEAESSHPDPVGDAVFIKNRVASAFERFGVRQDDWAAAEAIAREIAEGEPDRALVAHVYRGIRQKARPRLEKGKAKRSRSKHKSRPTLDELEAERREAEQERVRGLRRGPVKKRLK